ncbi:hypothetical protein ACFFIX_19640 [Metabacillus herbersteinensis]|uniref:ASCH domain-containing protein n=1 Tax=Metabacillus herbersteinensis TaxID=283816 RepID=A0ABV6GIS8_9BACI
MKFIHYGLMENNKNYILKKTDNRSSEYSLVKKNGDNIEVSFIGGDFEEQPHTVNFTVGVIHLIEGFEQLTLEDLTIETIEEVSVAIYNIYMSNQIPNNLKNKILVTW